MASKKNIKCGKNQFFGKFFICVILVMCLCSVLTTFAQSSDGTITELEGKAGKLMDLFSGKIMAIVMCVALIIIFGVIAWSNSQGEGGMFKKALPWVVGVIGVGSAAGITSYFMEIAPK